MDTALFPDCPNCFSHEVNFFDGIGNDDSVGTYNCSLGMTWWRWIESPDILQKPFLASTASRPASQKPATPPSSCKRVTPCALQRVTLTSRKFEGYSTRVEALDSLVASSVTSCVTILSQGTICASEYDCFLQFLDSNFFGLEPSDVNL